MPCRRSIFATLFLTRATRAQDADADMRYFSDIYGDMFRRHTRCCCFSMLMLFSDALSYAT